MFGLWFGPICRAIKLLWMAACAAVILRLGAWVLIPGHASDVRSFSQLRDLLRQAVLIDSVSVFSLLAVLAVFARYRAWLDRSFVVGDDLIERGGDARLPAWPVALRWITACAATIVCGLAIGVALNAAYALLRAEGLTSVDQHGASGVIFWVLDVWTITLWGFFGGCYLSSWITRKVDASARLSVENDVVGE